ncbi:DoxX family membrane protein [Halobium salinum]|uniref:DoxX family membrane protein n=1 Tax=Halobium salinum TaxID=1364940 RepID=A0ABD5PAJ4_9EURY|nr:DoxX family protein [Halobium salinum]
MATVTDVEQRRATGTVTDYAPLPLRLGVAYVVLVHGLGRFGVGPFAGTDVAGFAGFLASLGVPAPDVMAWVVTAVEVGGGVLLLLGLLTRLAAALIVADISVALWLVQLPAGYPAAAAGIERDLLLVLCALTLVVVGAGRPSLDRALFGGSPVRRLLGRLGRPASTTPSDD